MSRPTAQQIRSTFIDYFVKNDHRHVPSSPLIPHNDPSLMFVNSGMVQFKNVFTGQEQRPYTRATSSQKSVRAGGKHNDLDNVGYTARHHTFFEMLGNFSFGDYFKEEAIYYAWNLLTKEFGLQKEKLYTTIYHNDEEAALYWKKIAGLSDERIIRITTNDNFWSMGDTGPCGPCSEIFYDHGEHIFGGLPGTPDQDGDRYIEIWNMVFMQFEQVDKETRIPLPKKSIDTGMGLERVSAVLQGVHDNYDIDLFKDLIAFTESKLQIKAEGEARFSYRVIADHLRSCSFLIADGVMPSNEGRGYVLRRIMRRAMRHAHQLGAKDPLMYRLVPKLVDLMGGAYPELKRAEDFITGILEQEETRFKATLERGLKLLDEETGELPEGARLSGEVAFKLYDTYGFPLDLTEDILKKKEIAVDVEGFNHKMDEQRERARKSWSGSGEAKEDKVWFDIKAEYRSTEFLGYTLTSAEGKVVALVISGQRVDSIAESNKEFILIANQTPFYGESGGQMGDIGIIDSDNTRIKVLDTKKYLGSLHAHICVLEKGKIHIGDAAKFTIDSHYRKNLKAHHSATHILHAVLKEVLGNHIAQKGSLVAFDRLRFDISHPKALTQEEMLLIEDKVNEIITDNSKVETILMPLEDAISSGATALFGEKYDNEVRVVSMGVENLDGIAYSIELCGGTHVSRTGDIGSFKIAGENAIAAGVRRIEAICGEFVIKIARENEQVLNKVADALKGSRGEILDKVDSLLSSKKELEKELLRLQMAELMPGDDAATAVGEGARLIYKLVKDVDPKILREAAIAVASQSNDLIVVYISNIASKLSILVAVSTELSSKINASEIAKELSLFLGGAGGGGKPTLAQSGGTDNGSLSEVQDKVISIIKGLMK